MSIKKRNRNVIGLTIHNQFGFTFKRERYILTKVPVAMDERLCRHCDVNLTSHKINDLNVCSAVAGDHCNAHYENLQGSIIRRTQFVYKKEL